MMDAVWSFILYSLPWYVQVVLLAVCVGLPAYLIIAAVFGRAAANQLLLPIAGAIAALGFASKLQQDGYQDRRAEEEKALDKAEEIVVDKREEVQRMPDQEVRDETDRWSRK